MKSDGIWGGGASYPGKPACPIVDIATAEMQVREVLVKVSEPERLQKAWQQVRKNAGAAGIDQMTVEEIVQREEQILALIHDKLKSGSYRFQPVRRVEIPKTRDLQEEKAGNTGAVMDRIVGTSMHSVLEEIVDPDFTESNFGAREGRSEHQPIRQLQRLVKEGSEWVVAVDLQAFFREIPQGLILQLIRRKAADEQFVTLLAWLLKAGVNGDFEKTTKGCPQGSPFSSMLSNIVLNERDHKLEERNLGYCRWADDFVFVVKSERAAHRVMKGTIAYLEDELGLIVNWEKSRVSTKAQARLIDRIRELTRRNNPLSMYQVIHELNKYLRGWVGYFRIQEFKYLFRDLDAWIRSRSRSMQLKK